MSLQAAGGTDPRIKEALVELQTLIRMKYPEASFHVTQGEDPEGIYLMVGVDEEDLEAFMDVFMERLGELQVEEGLPVYVFPDSREESDREKPKRPSETSAAAPDRYDPGAIEKRWQERWAADRLYEVTEDPSRPKWYALTMYPYPSGDLHIGHWYAMAPSDVAARFKRRQGFNVLHPMGFDAFGLPAENAAIQRGIHPYTWTIDNIDNMRRQLRSMGASYPWEREIVTCDPEYYRWNQWFFLKFYEAGLAYRAMAEANWCPNCQTVLANEQVKDGTCERCGTPVTKRDLEQWFFRITRYAEELLEYPGLDWPERVKVMQRNWIGRSEGVETSFEIEGHPGERIPFFTTRPDTIFGVTFMVLAPEHPLVARITTSEQREAVEQYVAQSRRQTEIERLTVTREKTGVFTGAYAVNYFNGQRMPIWIADYVLMGYGTGAIMAVPAHDTRDFEFATKYGLPIPVVIAPPDYDGTPLAEAYLGEGTMVNSGQFNGSPSVEGQEKVADYIEGHKLGSRRVTYRLRDWLISRQRYWGTPIPIIYCPDCGAVPVPEKDLPVLLPQDAQFRPTGESPLLYHEAFVNTTCPHCGKPARRETDTMDTFVDSSWYFLRYCSPHYEQACYDPRKGKYWLPVDLYTGGIEHAVMHLLYARFFIKALRDVGVVDFGEPFIRLFNQGIIVSGGEKMSKSRGNVVSPDEYVEKYGADAVRIYLLFVGPWEEGGDWSPAGILGPVRFLHRVWGLVTKGSLPGDASKVKTDYAALRRVTHQTIKSATERIETFQFNTLVADLMGFVNEMAAYQPGPNPPEEWTEALRTLVLLLAPVAPHLAEEQWARLGGAYSVHQQPWPAWEERFLEEDHFTLVVQVNGKVRDRVEVPVSISREQVREVVLRLERVQRALDGRTVQDVIYVPGRLANVVIK